MSVAVAQFYCGHTPEHSVSAEVVFGSHDYFSSHYIYDFHVRYVVITRFCQLDTIF